MHNEDPKKGEEKNVMEDFGPVTLALTDFFFSEKMVKINTFVSTEGDNREFPVCYEIDKEELYDFILYADDWRGVLKANEAFQPDLLTNNGKMVIGKIPSLDRLSRGEDGDVVSLRIQPLVIRNIYLDLRIEIFTDDPTDPSKGVTTLTILNYYRK